ncbi:MAG: emp24/gp25L/p24 family protein [archaeon]|nr:emp24/gp25L/p24 family protein [archaeon]
MKIKGPSNDELYKKQDKVNAVASLTAPKTGSYTMCLENKEPQSVHVNFEFLSGVNAKDYSSIAKQSSLKPLELNLQKLEDTIGYIINEMSNIVVYQEKSLAVNDELGGKIILFSCITMFTMIIVGIIETVYIQKYLTNKKII